MHDRGIGVLWRCSVPESNNWRKRALECMRLAAECMQLARDAHGSALQSHFLRMAETWHALADQGLSADIGPGLELTDSPGPRADSATAWRSGTVYRQ